MSKYFQALVLQTYWLFKKNKNLYMENELLRGIYTLTLSKRLTTQIIVITKTLIRNQSE